MYIIDLKDNTPFFRSELELAPTNMPKGAVLTYEADKSVGRSEAEGDFFAEAGRGIEEDTLRSAEECSNIGA